MYKNKKTNKKKHSRFLFRFDFFLISLLLFIIITLFDDGEDKFVGDCRRKAGFKVAESHSFDFIRWRWFLIGYVDQRYFFLD